MHDEVGGEVPVRQQAAHQRNRNEAAAETGCALTPPRPDLGSVVNGRRLLLERVPNRDGSNAVEVSPLFEARSLASRELRIDEDELWADGRLQQHSQASKRPGRPFKITKSISLCGRRDGG